MLAALLQQEREAAWKEIQGLTNNTIKVSDYDWDGFQVFWHRASQEYPEVDFSGFIFDDDSRSPLVAEVV